MIFRTAYCLPGQATTAAQKLAMRRKIDVLVVYLPRISMFALQRATKAAQRSIAQMGASCYATVRADGSIHHVS